jgi:hypothetical protein
MDNSTLHVLRAGLGQLAASGVRDDGKKGLKEHLPDDTCAPIDPMVLETVGTCWKPKKCNQKKT